MRHPERLGDWGGVFVVYLGVSAVGHLLWEIVQLPLYTLFWEATAGQIAFAVIHCTMGDLLIASLSALAAWLFAGAPPVRSDAFVRVALVAILVGVAYTVFSEWWNVEVWRSWTYTSAMPRLPPWGTGLAPLLQWAIVPAVACGVAWKRIVLKRHENRVA